MSLRNRKTGEKPSMDYRVRCLCSEGRVIAFNGLSFYSQHNLPNDRLEQRNLSTMESFGDVLQQMRNTFKSGKTKDVKFRRRQLEAMMRMYEECEEQMIEALEKDLR